MTLLVTTLYHLSAFWSSGVKGVRFDLTSTTGNHLTSSTHVLLMKKLLGIFRDMIEFIRNETDHEKERER